MRNRRIHILFFFAVLALLAACQESKSETLAKKESNTISAKVSKEPSLTDFPDTVKYHRFASMIRENVTRFGKHDTAWYRRINKWAPLHHDFKKGDYNDPQLKGTPRLTFTWNDPFSKAKLRSSNQSIWSIDIHGKNLRKLIDKNDLHLRFRYKPFFTLSRSQDLRYLILSNRVEVALWDFKKDSVITIYKGARAGKGTFSKDEKFIFYYSKKGLMRYTMATGKKERWRMTSSGIFTRNDKYLVATQKGGFGLYEKKDCMQGMFHTPNKQPCPYTRRFHIHRDYLNTFGKKYEDSSDFGYTDYNTSAISWDGKYLLYKMGHKDRNTGKWIDSLEHHILIDIEKGYTGQEEVIPYGDHATLGANTNLIYLQKSYNGAQYPNQIQCLNCIYSFDRSSKTIHKLFEQPKGTGGTFLTYSLNPKEL